MSGLPPLDAIGVHPNATFPTDEVSRARPAGPGAAATFGTLVSQGLAQVDRELRTSQTTLQRLSTGDMQNLHQAMIQLEESRLSFQLMLQVRGRLLEAYQDIMKMQI